MASRRFYASGFDSLSSESNDGCTARVKTLLAGSKNYKCGNSSFNKTERNNNYVIWQTENGGGGCNLVSVPITPAHKQTSVNLCGESIKKQKKCQLKNI